MFFSGNPNMKRLQKIVNNPEKYDPNFLISMGFSVIVSEAGFKKETELNLIWQIVYNKRVRYYDPSRPPLCMSEELAKTVWPTMTLRGLEKLRNDIKSKGLKIDL